MELYGPLNLKTDPELLAKLIEAAKSYKMTPQERYAQRRSFLRGFCPSRYDYEKWCAVVDAVLPELP